MANNELLSIDDQTLVSIMNKRHRSAAKSFKSPPQPRFCIKESLEDGRDVFINVLSYSRIANQLSELDPVPLYGGMIIKSYSLMKNSLHQQQALQGECMYLIIKTTTNALLSLHEYNMIIIKLLLRHRRGEHFAYTTATPSA
jgi:hypothetical protein